MIIYDIETKTILRLEFIIRNKCIGENYDRSYKNEFLKISNKMMRHRIDFSIIDHIMNIFDDSFYE